MKKTTLCYITVGDRVLLIHRVKKKNDENAGMYIGLGGHFQDGETPLECVKREVFEEAGIKLASPDYRGIVHFSSDLYEDEEMHLFTAEAQPFVLPDCDEGELCLVTREKMFSLPTWEGDRIFLSLLFDGADFFDLSLCYRGDRLISAILDGRPAELFDLLDENGKRTGRFKERSLVHRDGDLHATVHTWIFRRTNGGTELLLQKRSVNKDAYPGCFDISSAGHLDRGEETEIAASRELFEELGLKAQKGELRFIGYFDHFHRETFRGAPFLDNEHSALFLYDGSGLSLEDLTLQKDEVECVRWFDAEYLTEHIGDGRFCLIGEEMAIVLKAIGE